MSTNLAVYKQWQPRKEMTENGLLHSTYIVVFKHPKNICRNPFLNIVTRQLFVHINLLHYLVTDDYVSNCYAKSSTMIPSKPLQGVREMVNVTYDWHAMWNYSFIVLDYYGVTKILQNHFFINYPILFFFSSISQTKHLTTQNPNKGATIITKHQYTTMKMITKFPSFDRNNESKTQNHKEDPTQLDKIQPTQNKWTFLSLGLSSQLCKGKKT